MSECLESPSSVDAAARFLSSKIDPIPVLAIVLGSGFNGFLNSLEILKRIPYGSIPGFSKPRVPGHLGLLAKARFNHTEFLVLSGRRHYYEGCSMDEVTFGVRVLSKLGLRSLLLTNAAGGIRKDLTPGDFMSISDHINFMGVNPLRGSPSFVDLTGCYDDSMRTALKRAGKRAKIQLTEGTYLAVSGPSYETPAEIRAFRTLGADAVGMSTVPEVIAARQYGLRVAGLSLITNVAAGMAPGKLDHRDVLQQARNNEKRLAALLQKFIEIFHEEI